MNRFRSGVALVAAAAVLGGCASTAYDPQTGLYARPGGGAPATDNETPYSEPLRCLASAASEAQRVAPRLAVGDIADLTGRRDLQTGRIVSQGAALFAVTALTRAGVPTVERLDPGVSEIERQYAQAHLLSDTPEQAGQSRENFRPVYAGEIAGSRYYVVGGVTELNYNIRSRGVDLAAGAVQIVGAKGGFTGSDYVMNVAIDLRLIDTISQEVVATASYQKQIVGHEIRAGVFNFMGGTLFDLTAGGSAMEPVQLAVRTAVELGLYDFVADLYSLPRDRCLAGAEVGDPSLLVRRLTAPPAAVVAPEPPPVLAAAPPPAAELHAPPPHVHAPAPRPYALPPRNYTPSPQAYDPSSSTSAPSARPRSVIEPGAWRLRTGGR
ncbi:MAG: holdfast anchoring protein HfaB [Caulobacteraceae bacterium]|nr:holdfast anchoring protein HfaB [Caulobacteraceae bacterium]